MTPLNLPDANALCQLLADKIRPHLRPNTALVGIHTGGVWLATYLHRALNISVPLGTLDVAFYRDDYSSRGLHQKPHRTEIPFDMNQSHVILVDDVLYTGRTTRAAINELFDYGRPACVELACLVDRLERQLPIAPTYCAHTLLEPLPSNTLLRLSSKDEAAEQFELQLVERPAHVE